MPGGESAWGMSLDAAGYDLFAYLARVLWHSSVVFVGVAALAWFLRRTRASDRCTLWMTAILLAPTLPLLSSLAGRFAGRLAEVPLMPAYAQPAPVRTRQPVLPSEPVRPRPARPTPTSPLESAVGPPPTAVDEPDTRGRETASVLDREPVATSRLPLWRYPWALGLLAYAGIVVVFWGWIIAGHLCVVRWVHKATLVADERVLSIFREVRVHFALSRDFLILESQCVAAPVSAGVFRTFVLLPPDLANNATDEELRAVAAHELAHAARRDARLLLLVSLVKSALFFHPLVWFAAHRISTHSEQAADDAVLDGFSEPVPYARMLTRLARRLRRRRLACNSAAGIVLSKSAFLRRAESILAERRRGPAATSRLSLGVSAAGVFLAVAVASGLPLGQRDGPEKPGAIVLTIERWIKTKGGIHGITLSPDGSRLYVAYWGNEDGGPIEEYDVPTGTRLRTFPFSERHFHGGVILSKDGRLLYTTNY